MNDFSKDIELEEPINFSELMRTLWVGKIIIAAVTLICGLAAVIYALNAREWWRAEAVLIRVQGEGSLSLGLDRLGGLASLVGLNLDAAEASQEPIAVLRSRDLAKEFIDREGILDLMFNEIKGGDGLAGLKALLSFSRKQGDVTDIRDVVKFFNEKVMSVSEDKRAGTIRVAMVWRDPQMAAVWANSIVQAANDRLRMRAQTDADRNVKFLRSEMEDTKVASLQQSLGRLLEQEMQKLLIARGNEEFAFRIIDRAFAPRERYRPKRTLIVLGASLLGFVMASLGVLLAAKIRG